MDVLRKSSTKIVEIQLQEINSTEQELKKAEEEWKKRRDSLVNRIKNIKSKENYYEIKLLELLSTLVSSSRVHLPYYFSTIAERSPIGNLFEGYSSIKEKNSVVPEIIKYSDFFLSGTCTLYLKVEGELKGNRVEYFDRLVDDEDYCTRYDGYKEYLEDGPSIKYYTGKDKLHIDEVRHVRIPDCIMPEPWDALYPVRVCWLEMYHK